MDTSKNSAMTVTEVTGGDSLPPGSAILCETILFLASEIEEGTDGWVQEKAAAIKANAQELVEKWRRHLGRTA